MSDGVDGLAEREPSLIRLYMELMGASESSARSVFMHICEREEKCASLAGGQRITEMAQEKPRREPFTSRIEQAEGWLSHAAAVPTGG